MYFYQAGRCARREPFLPAYRSRGPVTAYGFLRGSGPIPGHEGENLRLIDEIIAVICECNEGADDSVQLQVS